MPRRRALARHGVRAALGVLLALAALLTSPPRAARAEDDATQLRERLLKARTLGEREGALKVVLTRPADVGAVIGPLFGRPEYGASTDLLVSAAKLLAENPVPGPGGKGEVVLLAEAIFQRAANDPVFVARLRDALAVDPLTERAPDWERLVENALQALTGPDARGAARVAQRIAALRFLGFEDGPRAARVVDELERHARRLRQDAPEPGEERAAEVKALLEALAQVLVYRFGSLDVALPELERTRGWSYIRRLRYFSGLKTAADRDRSLAVLHGVSAIRAMSTPAELATVFATDQFPYPEHQVAALSRAAQLSPQATAPWEELYRAVLAHSHESGVVETALDHLADAGFGGGPSECCKSIAQALARRLGDPVFKDASELRRRIVAALGDLAAREQVQALVAARLERRVVAPDEIDEVLELVRAVGRCRGLDVGTYLRPFYDLSQLTLPAEDPTLRERFRTEVARSLGREGVRGGDPAGAERALVGILQGTDGWERATNVRVREQAFRGLSVYPSDDVVRMLVATALDPASSVEEARGAVEALGQMLLSGEAGAKRSALALASLLDQTLERGDMEERRVEILKRLRQLPPEIAPGGEPHAAVLAGVRAALGAPGSDLVRLEAARTAAALADVDALARLTAWWIEKPDPAVGDLLRSLLEAVVRAGPSGDAQVAEALASVAAAPGQAGQAVAWADLVVRTPGRAVRPTLLRAQAGALLARAASRAGDPTGGPERIEDLSAAMMVLTTVVSAGAAPEVEPARRQLIEALEALAQALGDGPTAADRLLQAVDQAVRSRDRVVLQAGERIARRLLASESLLQHLSAERRTDLETKLAQLLELLEKQP